MKVLIAAACAVVSLTCFAATDEHQHHSHRPTNGMVGHSHEQGEFMLTYRFMHMTMQGNQTGRSGQSPETIVTTEPNRFAGQPMQPPTLRVVPTKMTMDMHMLGAMYAPGERITLMGMVNYIENEMQHLTFGGPLGIMRLGTFTTRSSGLGDTTLSALFNVREGSNSRWQVTTGVSLPTGDIRQQGRILTPMNLRPSVRLPYPMQHGSGTYDLMTGLTYSARSASWDWGAEWRSTFRLGENDENYTLGNEHRVTGWLSYLLKQHISLSARLEYHERGNIDLIDALIVAPVQTADPDRQGFERVDAGLSIKFLLPVEKQQLTLEVNAPIAQKLDGPQLETDWYASFGWQLTL